MRRSLLERVETGIVSPISPDVPMAPGVRGVWGNGGQLGPDEGRVARPPVGRRSGSREREDWWK